MEKKSDCKSVKFWMIISYFTFGFYIKFAKKGIVSISILFSIAASLHTISWVPNYPELCLLITSPTANTWLHLTETGHKENPSTPATSRLFCTCICSDQEADWEVKPGITQGCSEQSPLMKSLWFLSWMPGFSIAPVLFSWLRDRYPSFLSRFGGPLSTQQSNWCVSLYAVLIKPSDWDGSHPNDSPPPPFT